MKCYVKIKDDEIVKMSDRIPGVDSEGWLEAVYFVPSLSEGQSLDYIYAETDKNPIEIRWKIKDRDDVP